MNILPADRVPEFLEEELGALRFNVRSRPELGANELPDAISGVHVLVVRATKVGAATIETASSLKLVIRAGAGTHTIDCEAAAERAIHVANCPG